MKEISNKARYLILTADERTWKFDEPVLFLGDWCKRYDRKDIWSTMDAIVAEPYGVISEEKDRDYLYVNKLKVTMIDEVSGILNEYHKINYSTRYWRILMGHWMHRYISLMYNRYFTLDQCIKQHNICGITLFAEDSIHLSSSDSEQLIWNSQGKTWNNVLYAKILPFLTDVNLSINYIKLNNEEPSKGSDTTSGRLSLPQKGISINRRILKYLRQKLNNFLLLFSRANDALIIKSYLPKKIELNLKMGLGQIPIIWDSPKTHYFEPDKSLRDDLLKKYKNPNYEGFEKCIREMFFELLPSCYLEGYKSLIVQADELPWPSSPKFIFTCNSFDTDEVCKAYIAAKVERGSPYYTGQHGNNYGSYKFVYSEDECTETSDKFFTWGWNDGSTKLTPAFNFIIAGRHNINYDKKGGLILVEVHIPQPIETWDIYPDFNKYQEDQFNFVEKLPSKIKQALVVRLHHGFRMANWFENLQWENRYPNIKIDYGLYKISKLVSGSRLIVISYNSTLMLDLLALNIPIICFWSNQLDDIRDSAKPLYTKLKHAEILHFTSESASEKITEVWDDIPTWWASDVVQSARKEFCDTFSRKSTNPVRQLKKLLTEGS